MSLQGTENGRGFLAVCFAFVYPDTLRYRCSLLGLSPRRQARQGKGAQCDQRFDAHGRANAAVGTAVDSDTRGEGRSLRAWRLGESYRRVSAILLALLPLA